ncbi:hypothetical protein KAJ61_05360 [Candidatus Parcubacteria bacterium]|nr:hypothetical protein [Candidatus Parcubacteria bacterium]
MKLLAKYKIELGKTRVNGSVYLFLKSLNETNILARLGELVDDEKREWVKKNLKNEVLKQLAIEIKILE